MNSKIINGLICLYILTLNFTDAFSLTRWIKIPFLFITASTILAAAKLLLAKKINYKIYNPEDWLVILGLTFIVAASVINPNSSSINYVVAYFFIFGACYLFLKLSITQFCDLKTILKTNYYAVLILSIYVTISFFLFELADVNIDALLPRSKDPNATFMGIKRSYGFTTEPSPLALYFNTLGVLALWYQFYYLGKTFNVKTIASTGLVAFAWLTTFSGAGIPLLIISFFLMSILSLVLTASNSLNPKNCTRLFFAASGLLLLIFFSPSGADFFLQLFDKIALSSDSSPGRLGRWQGDFQRVIQSPIIGNGPGMASEAGRGSSINWYLFLALEAGIFPPLFFAAFIFFSIIRTISSNIGGKYLLASGVLAGGGHFLAIATFWHPFLWTLIAAITVIIYQDRYIGSTRVDSGLNHHPQFPSSPRVQHDEITYNTRNSNP